jgi:flavin-dependent dehydrogenase
MKSTEIIIIGAGLAGLTAARELAAAGRDVLIFEKQRFPHHKVCGEYLSREVVPYLEKAGIPLGDAPVIDELVLGSPGGRRLACNLPLGGIGISRYALDNRLYQAAEKAGARFVWEPVESVVFEAPYFKVRSRGGAWQANHVLGTWGKRSGLDRTQSRYFFSKSSPWMGIKMHYQAHYPSHQVGLYGFKGGYAGLSVTETGAVNFCYLIHRERFRETPNLASCTRKLLKEHPGLAAVLDTAQPLFEAPLGISNIYFGGKGLVEDHILMSGDAARLIHPLCGNGMAMAIQGGRLQAKILSRHGGASTADRKLLEREFTKEWQKEFRTRLWVGARLQEILTSPVGMDLGIRAAALAPPLLRTVIRKTHGTI